MAIIGKLLQQTAAYTYKLTANKGVEYKYQLEVLRKLLSQAKNTKFGLVHNFHTILLKQDAVSEYQENVPITDYEEFYKMWLQESIEGAKDHTWRGKIKFYALSSGTTGSPSKRIPVTQEMIRSFQRTSLRQFSIIHELDLPEVFFGSSLLTVGGSTKLTTVGKHVEGDLSGILRKHASLVVMPFTKPGKKITDLKTWNEKLEAILPIAPSWNIGIIAGIPSWCILLMEKLIDHYQLNSIHDIWPNLQVYVHGGVFMEPYIDRLQKISSKPIFLLDTYLASEGYFAYQVSTSRTGMKLLLNNGIFFEFIPFNWHYFDENGDLKNKHEALTISQVEVGVDYAIVISTNAGLWRYLIGDLVRFIDIEEREIIISGRIKQFLSLCGEHLSLDNINQALLHVGTKHQTLFSEFTIFADYDELRHYWYLGSDKEVDTEQFTKELDAELCLLNDDYAYVRKYNLQEPKIQVIAPTLFYDFLDWLGKSGGQSKMPRVLNKEQSIKWCEFLKDKAIG